MQNKVITKIHTQTHKKLGGGKDGSCMF